MSPPALTIHPDTVALDALVWVITHDPDRATRTGPVDAVAAMRAAMAGLYAGEFRAWDPALQRRAADELAGYLAVALDERREAVR